MKVFFRVATLVTLAGLTALFSSCHHKNPGPDSTEKQQLDKLSKTWNIVSASLDGSDRTSDFTNFQLTISGTFPSTTAKGPYNYSVSGSRPSPSPWPESGTWSFGDNAASEIIRTDDNLPISYSINSSQLTLEFTCLSCAYPGARVGSVNGDWIFVLN